MLKHGVRGDSRVKDSWDTGVSQPANSRETQNEGGHHWEWKESIPFTLPTNSRTSAAKCRCREGNSPDEGLRILSVDSVRRKWGLHDAGSVGLEASTRKWARNSASGESSCAENTRNLSQPPKTSLIGMEIELHLSRGNRAHGSQEALSWEKVERSVLRMQAWSSVNPREKRGDRKPSGSPTSPCKARVTCLNGQKDGL